MILKIKRKRVPLIFKIFIIVFLIGIPIFAVGVFYMNIWFDIKNNTVTIFAEITDIENPDPLSDGKLPTVYVNYEYGDKSFADVKVDGVVKLKMNIGDTIELLCPKDDPEKVFEPSAINVLGGILLGVGIALMLIGGLPVITEIILGIRNRKLKKNGVKIEASVDEITRMQIKFLPQSLSPYNVYCRYGDDEGKVFRFKSFWTWYNPNLALVIGSTVPVYVKPKNALKYFVDVRSVMRGKFYDLAC